jgi:hypothetical protein
VSDQTVTKAELQEELRRHDLPVSGTKDELRERLSEAGRGSDEGNGKSDGDGSGNGNGHEPGHGGRRRQEQQQQQRRPRPGQVAQRAARQLAELTRRPVEGVAGLAREQDGWCVELEVVEVARVPSSTDVLGLYAVWVDEEGELLGYERVERFVRGRAGGEEG